jgi:hypothetical protein
LLQPMYSQVALIPPADASQLVIRRRHAAVVITAVSLVQKRQSFGHRDLLRLMPLILHAMSDPPKGETTGFRTFASYGPPLLIDVVAAGWHG